MILHVKNMVCDRCILMVKQQVENLGFGVEEISLGKVQLKPDPSAVQLDEISAALTNLGFELIDKEKDQLVEALKTEVIALIHHGGIQDHKQSIIHMVAEKLHKDQAYLSRLFSDKEGITVEKYIIQQRIEKVKELLQYGELNLNEIAYQLGYSSSAHLSTQFKSVTGSSPSAYKTSTTGSRKPLDKVLK
ncbi:AraC family transcriptional regulator [Pedobacter sp. PWIIR3]